MGAYSSHSKPNFTCWTELQAVNLSKPSKGWLVGEWDGMQSMEVCELQWIPGMFTLPKFNMGVSKNRGGPPKSWILIGFSMK